MTIKNQPLTLPHDFTLSPLRAHFAKTPNPPASNRLIDLPPTEFLDTAEEITVMAAALWVLAVRWEEMEEEKRPKTKEALRKWIGHTRIEVIKKLADKVEPPFHAFSIDDMEQEVGGMMEQLLMQTLPPPPEKIVDGSKKADDKKGKAGQVT